jgi:hypothetical protein
VPSFHRRRLHQMRHLMPFIPDPGQQHPKKSESTRESGSLAAPSPLSSGWAFYARSRRRRRNTRQRLDFLTAIARLGYLR